MARFFQKELVLGAPSPSGGPHSWQGRKLFRLGTSGPSNIWNVLFEVPYSQKKPLWMWTEKFQDFDEHDETRENYMGSVLFSRQTSEYQSGTTNRTEFRRSRINDQNRSNAAPVCWIHLFTLTFQYLVKSAQVQLPSN